MRHGKRSQMEIMGLAIIVILVSIGMLFALMWMLQAPATKPVQRAKESVLIANFLNTAAGVTTECNQRTVRELLRDCALTGGVTTCLGQSSCDYVNSILETMFNETLDAWGYDYYFTVEGTGRTSAINFGEPCPGERERKSAPLPVQPGFEISLVLELCR